MSTKASAMSVPLGSDPEEVIHFIRELAPGRFQGVLRTLISKLGDPSVPMTMKLNAAFGVNALASRVQLEGSSARIGSTLAASKLARFLDVPELHGPVEAAVQSLRGVSERDRQRRPALGTRPTIKTPPSDLPSAPAPPPTQQRYYVLAAVRSSRKMHASKPLSSAEVFAELAKRVKISRGTSAKMMKALASLAYREAESSFTLPGLGTLVLVDRKERMGRSTATGSAVKVPAKKAVKFKIAKAARAAILGTKR